MALRGGRTPDTSGWNGTAPAGRRRLRETSPLVTLAIHVVLVLAGGAVGAVALFLVTDRFFLGLFGYDRLSGGIGIVLAAGFCGGALFSLRAIVRTRRDMSEFEKRHGPRHGDHE